MRKHPQVCLIFYQLLQMKYIVIVFLLGTISLTDVSAIKLKSDKLTSEESAAAEADLDSLMDKYDDKETYKEAWENWTKENEKIIDFAVKTKDKYLPDKAFDVIDETGASKNLYRDNDNPIKICIHDIENTISFITQIPKKNLSSSDVENLKDIETKLKTVIFGQDEAIKVLSNAIKLSRVGLRDENKTIGSFLFTGPTGVGKTEISKQLSTILGVPLLRFDMSEYMERHAVSRLIGAPPGYVGSDQGGLLTDSVTKSPNSVILLDEIEKAHPDIFNILLQVMDAGILTDNNGRKADFRNCVLIMTTNVGAQLLSKRNIGFNEQSNKSDAMESLKRLFSPEFRNRLDEIIEFNSLDIEVILSVADKFMTKLQAQLDERNIEIVYKKDLLKWIAEKSYNKEMGARPMERFITDNIKKPLVDKILDKNLKEGGVINISIKAGKVSFIKKKITAKVKK